MIYGGFHCILRCGNNACDLVRVVGKESLVADFDEHGMWNGEYCERFEPNLFLPALPLVESRAACPPPVQERADAAAKLIWLDASSAANRLRSAIEALLDDQGIPKRGVSSAGKPFDVKLHARIENLTKAKPVYADATDLLLAVKWIGNVGSHDDSLKTTDVLDGAEILDYTLELIYDDGRDALKKKAAEIAARKGIPAGRRPRGN